MKRLSVISIIMLTVFYIAYLGFTTYKVGYLAETITDKINRKVLK